MNMHAKVLNKRLATEILIYQKRVTHYDRAGFIPRTQKWLNVSNSAHNPASQQIKGEQHTTIPEDHDNHLIKFSSYS